MNFDEITNLLESNSNLNTQKIYKNHGWERKSYGCSFAVLKKISKKCGINHILALKLWDFNTFETRVLACAIVDVSKLTEKDIDLWLKQSPAYTIVFYIVRLVAFKSKYREDLLNKWFKSKNTVEYYAAWILLSCKIQVLEEKLINKDLIREKLEYVEKNIHYSENFAKKYMNEFLIAVGVYYQPLSDLAIKIAKEIKNVEFHINNTSCVIPLALQSINKAKLRKAKKPINFSL